MSEPIEEYRVEVVTGGQFGTLIVKDATNINDPILGKTRTLEHARRFAACWNACVGLPTNYLESVEFKERLETARNLQIELDWHERRVVSLADRWSIKTE